MQSFIRKPHTFGCKARLTGLTITGALALGLLVAGAGAANAATLTGLEGNLAGGDTATTTVNGITFAKVFTNNASYSTYGLTPDGQLYGWGAGSNGQLGNGQTTDSANPVPVTMSGVLNGKVVTQVAAAGYAAAALTSDGAVYTWGYNAVGQLGNGTTTQSALPVAVTTTGTPMAGKKIVQVTANNGGFLALASDGTLFTWGDNAQGQLGNGATYAYGQTPSAVTQSGVLSGKTITQISGLNSGFVVLASDGTVYSWGYNTDGRLGNNSTTQSSVPVAVSTSGVLAGKVVTQVAAGGAHTLALTSSGQLFSWGANTSGQLGNGTTTNSSVPVAVTMSGALSGKTITSLSATYGNSIALTSDGLAYTWGDGSSGLGGTGSTTVSNPLPQQVTSGGQLAGKSLSSVVAGVGTYTGTTSDGGVYAWGDGTYGQLGNSTLSSSSSTPKTITLPSVSVKVDGVAATGVARVSPTQVSFVTPAHAAGTVAITASAGGNASYNTVATSGASFVYDAAPAVSGVLSDAVQGTAYSKTLSAGTGAGTTAFSITAGALPAGLSLNSTTGVVSGTPTSTGSQTFTVKATNASGTDSKSYTLGVYATPVLASGALAPAGKGVAYTGSVASTASSASTFSVSAGTLPDGLSLNASTGDITGTPTTGGTASFTIQAANAAGTVTKAYSIAVRVAAVISTATLDDPVVGQKYSAPVVAAGSGAIAYAVTAGALPDGLSLDAATGYITGKATSTTAATFSITATNSQGSDVKSFTVNPHQVPVFTDTITGVQDVIAGKAASVQLQAAGSGTLAYSVSKGSLPAGLSLDAVTGAITGTPTGTGGIATVTVTASNAYGSIDRVVSLDVRVAPSITDSDISAATVGSTYGAVVNAAGDGPLQYTMSKGGLPAGVTLNTATGAISGTPKTAGSYGFTITVASPFGTASKDYTIKVAAMPVNTVTVPGPTVNVPVPGPTVNVPVPGPTVTVPGPTTTVTVPGPTVYVQPLKVAKPRPVVAGKTAKIVVANLVKGEKYTITIKGKKLASGTATGKTMTKSIKVAKTLKGKTVVTITGNKHGNHKATTILTITKK